MVNGIGHDIDSKTSMSRTCEMTWAIHQPSFKPAMSSFGVMSRRLKLHANAGIDLKDYQKDFQPTRNRLMESKP